MIMQRLDVRFGVTGSGRLTTGVGRQHPLAVELPGNVGIWQVATRCSPRRPSAIWNSRRSILSITSLGCQLAGTAFQGTTLLCLRKMHDLRSTIPQVIA